MFPVVFVKLHTYWRQQPLLVVQVQSRYHTRMAADKSFISIRNIRNESYHTRNRPYLCVSVRIASVWRSVTCHYVSTLIFYLCRIFESFQKLHVQLTDPADTIRTATDDCVYDMHSYG